MMMIHYDNYDNMTIYGGKRPFSEKLLHIIYREVNILHVTCKQSLISVCEYLSCGDVRYLSIRTGD